MAVSSHDHSPLIDPVHQTDEIDFEGNIRANESLESVESSFQGAIDDPSTEDTIENRVTLIAEQLSIFDSQAWFLAAMFNPNYYARTYDLNHLNANELFNHFIHSGIPNNYSPSPAFDPEYTKEQIQLLSSDEHEQGQEPVLTHWLTQYYDTVDPHALFDGDFYTSQYEDLTDSATNPYFHFATNGIYENRIPCQFLHKHINIVFTHFEQNQANVEAIFSSIPIGSSQRFLQDETQIILKKIFMADLYKAQLGKESDFDENVLYSHFLIEGCNNQFRPTVLFNTEWYLQELQSYCISDEATDTLREFKQYSAEQIEQLRNPGASTPFLHWFFNGMNLGIVPTPIFDTDHYYYSHPDIQNNWNHHPFKHFIETGYKEPFRRFSIYFETNHYTQQAQGIKYSCALLDYILRGQQENLSPVAGLQLEHFSVSVTDQLATSPIEKAAIYFNNRLKKLESNEIKAMVEKATALEPQLVRPYGARLVRMAPIFHPESTLMDNMKDIVGELKKSQYDIVILMPHCRMAGSANVAGQFTKTISEFISSEKILVITTDLSAFERPDWFPENVDVFGLSEHMGKFPQERKIRVLLDLVRGLRPKKLININSNLGWHLTKTFGKQLSAWMDIYFYLFCWDRDSRGNKGGYPIQWFLPSFNYVKTIFTDNNALKEELQSRYCLTDSLRNKIVTLHTPAAETSVNYQSVLAERVNNKSVRRVFWSGRFDKQKRIDVLFAIAKRMPDLEFWVWGKSVLKDSEVTENSAPDNVRFMGTYTSLDDLPIASCDLFLYTSGWDGLPIILIDVASRGIPIIASKVGGVGDLVTTDTGWPIEDYANPDAYCEAINSVLANYENALATAQLGRTHALELCNEEKYREALGRAMGIADQPQSVDSSASQAA